jgi:hypothetical protein
MSAGFSGLVFFRCSFAGPGTVILAVMSGATNLCLWIIRLENTRLLPQSYVSPAKVVLDIVGHI